MANEIKSTFLGMPFGTASNKLRKSIIFMLVKETGRDICFRCGEEISSVEELSIEHKEPWLNRNPELFWDLDNIAFSHTKCNTRHTYGRKIGGGDTAWCRTHQDFLPVEKFGKESRRWNGLRDQCFECVSLTRKKAIV